MAYVIIILERHSGPDVQLFARQEDAVAAARRTAQEFARDPEDVEEGLTPPMTEAGWLYYATWSPEGDSVFVVEREVG